MRGEPDDARKARLRAVSEGDEPQQRQALPPIEHLRTICPDYELDVTEPDEEGVTMLTFRVPGMPPVSPSREFIFPISAETKKALGEKLTAPSVIVPDGLVTPA